MWDRWGGGQSPNNQTLPNENGKCKLMIEFILIVVFLLIWYFHTTHVVEATLEGNIISTYSLDQSFLLHKFLWWLWWRLEQCWCWCWCWWWCWCWCWWWCWQGWWWWPPQQTHLVNNLSHYTRERWWRWTTPDDQLDDDGDDDDDDDDP